MKKFTSDTNLELEVVPGTEYVKMDDKDPAVSGKRRTPSTEELNRVKVLCNGRSPELDSVGFPINFDGTNYGAGDGKEYEEVGRRDREEYNSDFVVVNYFGLGYGDEGQEGDYPKKLEFEEEEEESLPFSMLDAYQEIHGVNTGDLFLFGEVKSAGTSHGQNDVLKDPPVPSNLKGNNFCALLGTHRSCLELFLTKRKIKEPAWLSVSKISSCGVPQYVSWWKFETTVESAKDIRVSKFSKNAGTSPVVVTAMDLKTMTNEKENVDEIVSASIICCQRSKIDALLVGAEWTHPAVHSHFTIVCDNDGPTFPVGSTIWDGDVLVGLDASGFDLDILLQRIQIHAQKGLDMSRCSLLEKECGDFCLSQILSGGSYEDAVVIHIAHEDTGMPAILAGSDSRLSYGGNTVADNDDKYFKVLTPRAGEILILYTGPQLWCKTILGNLVMELHSSDFDTCGHIYHLVQERVKNARRLEGTDIGCIVCGWESERPYIFSFLTKHDPDFETKDVELIDQLHAFMGSGRNFADEFIAEAYDKKAGTFDADSPPRLTLDEARDLAANAITYASNKDNKTGGDKADVHISVGPSKRFTHALYPYNKKKNIYSKIVEDQGPKKRRRLVKMSEMKCTRYNEMGHSVRNCPKPN